MAPTIEIFCCYAREDQELLLQRQGLITIWSDTNINAGSAWEEEIAKHLDSSHIILLLVSADFMASDYCYSKEMQRAMQRHERGEARVIPIILRPILWRDAPFSKLQALPTNAKPITHHSWHTEDDALLDVAEQISSVVKALRIQYTLAEAGTLSTQQRYEEALVFYDQVVRLEPDSVPAHLGKGAMLLALERYEESLASFDQAVQINATVADAHFYENKALALSKLQRYEESLAAYDEALRLNPRAVHCYTEKVQILLQIHRYSEALATYQQLTHLEPNNAEHYQHLGDLLLELGSSTQALEAYAQAIRLNPNVAMYYAKLGTLLADLKRDEEALTAYEECIQIGTHTDPYCYHGKGKALFGLRRYTEAIAVYEQALDLDMPDPDPQFYHEIGKVYEALAQQAYEREKQARLQWIPRENTLSHVNTAIRAEAFDDGFL